MWISDSTQRRMGTSHFHVGISGCECWRSARGTLHEHQKVTFLYAQRKSVSFFILFYFFEPWQIWSKGKYNSVEHKAVMNKNKTRISIGSFFTPHNDAEVEPLDHMANSLRPKIYSKIMYGDYRKQAFMKQMET